MSDSESSLNDAGGLEQNPVMTQQTAGNDDLSSSGESEAPKRASQPLKSQPKEVTQTIAEFVKDKDAVTQGYKLAACMRALCLAYGLQPSNRFNKYIEATDQYSNFCAQTEAYTSEDLIRGIKILINQRKTIETFNELWGFDLFPLFLGQRQEETKPDATTPFPDAEKARVIFEILNHLNPHMVRYVYTEFQDSKIVCFVNFVAMFPLYCCPSQQLRQEARSIIDKWRAPLRQARKAAEELAKEPDEDENDEEQGVSKRRRKQQIQFEEYEANDYELQRHMERVRQREEQEKKALE